MTPYVFVALLCLSAALSAPVSADGSCVFGDPRAPLHILSSGGTQAIVSGSGIKVLPRHASGLVLESDFILAEVMSIHELSIPESSPETHCISSLDTTAIDLEAEQRLNISDCGCTHSAYQEVFPASTAQKTGVRVNFTCPGYEGLSLRLDVVVVNESHSIAHEQFNSTEPTYDRYMYDGTQAHKVAPNTVKFNVEAANFPWVGDSSRSYAAIFIKSAYRSQGAILRAVTETEKLSVNLTSTRSAFHQEVQRAFVLDGLSYMTPENYSILELGPLDDGIYNLTNGIALCHNKRPPGFHPQNISYDPTLSAAFFGDLSGPVDEGLSPKTKKSNKIVVAVVVPVVVCVALAVVIALFFLGKTSTSFKNWARPYRNRDK